MYIFLDVFIIIVQLLNVNSLLHMIYSQKWDKAYMEVLYDTLAKNINWNMSITYLRMNNKYINFIFPRFKKYMDMKLLCRYCDLSEDIIRDNEDILDFQLLSSRDRYKPYTLRFIREYQLRWNWKDITRNIIMPEKFILEFANMIDWDEASKRQPLTTYIIRTYFYKINVRKLYANIHPIDWNAIEDLISWDDLSMYMGSYMSTNIINKYISKLNIGIIVDNSSSYNRIPEECILKNIKYFYPYISTIKLKQKLSEDCMYKVNKYACANMLPCIKNKSEYCDYNY